MNRVKNVEVQDTYEPLEEGLDTVVVKRYLSLFEVTLTKTASANEKREAGYQAPLPASEINTEDNARVRKQVKQSIEQNRQQKGYRAPLSERGSSQYEG